MTDTPHEEVEGQQELPQVDPPGEEFHTGDGDLLPDIEEEYVPPQHDEGENPEGTEATE